VPPESVVAAARLPDGGIAVITAAGLLARRDSSGQEEATMIVPGTTSEGRQPEQLTVVGDDRLVVGLAKRPPRESALIEALIAVDLSDWTVVGTAELERPLWSLAASPAGRLYGVDRAAGSVLELDARDFSILSEMPVGPDPAVVVAVSPP
jgi:hypothetical protein